jgi:hypothetical protein
VLYNENILNYFDFSFLLNILIESLFSFYWVFILGY